MSVAWPLSLVALVNVRLLLFSSQYQVAQGLSRVKNSRLQLNLKTIPLISKSCQHFASDAGLARRAVDAPRDF